MSQYPGTSFILEWENAKLSEMARAKAMLATLSAQMAEISGDFAETPEVIITFDPDALTTEFIQDIFDGSWNSSAEVELKIIPAPDMEYYDQKNFGAQHATRAWLLFVDSDVVPEPDWLKNLLSARRTSNSAIVSGETYVEPNRFIDRAFALFWFFPLRSTKTESFAAESFYANNFAVERTYFLNHPFPENDLVRGRCYVLSKNILDGGETIEVNPSAKVGHPPPNGFGHFFRRSVIAGYDFHEMDKIIGAPIQGSGLRIAVSRAKWNLQDAFGKISSEGKSVGLGCSQRVMARGLAVTYFGLAALGEVVSLFAPRFVRRTFTV